MKKIFVFLILFLTLQFVWAQEQQVVKFSWSKEYGVERAMLKNTYRFSTIVVTDEHNHHKGEIQIHKPVYYPLQINAYSDPFFDFEIYDSRFEKLDAEQITLILRTKAGGEIRFTKSDFIKTETAYRLNLTNFDQKLVSIQVMLADELINQINNSTFFSYEWKTN